MSAPATGGAPAFAAVDLGASSGRVVLGRVLGHGPGRAGEPDRGPRVVLEEVARFPNGPVAVPTGSGERLHWDVLALWSGVLDGLRAAQRAALSGGGAGLAGIGVDSWAVDYGLLDADGALLGSPVHYRDARTVGVPERVHAQVPAAELYGRTGVQVQPFTTLFQLVAAAGDTQTRAARRLLLVPDLLGHWLSGAEVAEVTNASTTGLLDARTRTWAADLAARLGIDPALLPPLVEPGTVVGRVRGHLLAVPGAPTAGAPVPLVAVGSHDTASAVVGVPAAGRSFAYVSCGTWSLVGVELDGPVLTEAGRAANFTNELGVDGTVRYLRNVMGLWLLQESLRTWGAAGVVVGDLGALLAAAERERPLRTVVDVDDAAFLPPGDMPARIAAAARASRQPVPDGPVQVVRCILDSLALAHRRAVRQAAELSGRQVDVVHLVGGGARNAPLCRLTAQATGLPVVAGPAEAAALGNVLVQARAVGALPADLDLAGLRAIGARGLELVRYPPDGGPSEAAWSAAESRLPPPPAGHSGRLPPPPARPSSRGAGDGAEGLGSQGGGAAVGHPG